jgi:hypothetical protein
MKNLNPRGKLFADPDSDSNTAGKPPMVTFKSRVAKKITIIKNVIRQDYPIDGKMCCRNVKSQYCQGVHKNS